MKTISESITRKEKKKCTKRCSCSCKSKRVRWTGISTLNFNPLPDWDSTISSDL